MEFLPSDLLLRRLRPLIVLVVACGALVAAAPASAAVGTLDSSCSPSGTVGYAQISGGFSAAQTFTAGASGKVRYVDVERVTRNAGGTGGGIDVELLAVDQSGTPVGPALSSTTIPAAQITADTVPRTLSATFDPLDYYQVVAGTSYAVALKTADTALNTWYVGNNSCPGAIYSSSGGGPFGSAGFVSGEDAGLRTYVGPPNDLYAYGQQLTGSTASVNGTTVGSTPEYSEAYFNTEDQASTGRSVWYHWTAPAGGSTTIDTCTTSYDTLLAVFTGSRLVALTQVATNNNGCPSGYGSKVTFNATEGTAYHVEVDGCCGAPEGTFTLALAGQSPPAPPTPPTPPASETNPTASTPTPTATTPIAKKCKKAKKGAAAAKKKKCKK
jgi:hypothetical protein